MFVGDGRGGTRLQDVLIFIRRYGIMRLTAAASGRLMAPVRRYWRCQARAARQRLGFSSRLRILVIDDRVPAAESGSGFGRSLALLKCLAALGHRVTLFPLDDEQPVVASHLLELRRLGVKVIRKEFWRMARDHAELYDVVLVSRPHNLSATKASIKKHFTRSYVIYDSEALYYVRDQLKASVTGQKLDETRLGQLKRTELDLLRSADHILVVSEYEKKIIEREVPDVVGRITVWSYAVVCAPSAVPFEARSDLLFVGSLPRDSPNEYAVNHFLDLIWPSVNAGLKCRFHVVGAAPDALRGRASPVIDVVGFVSDLSTYYDEARVFVVPHLYSAGISLKLIEAMSRGVPAVVSELTAKQLGLEDGVEVLIGRTPDEFARKVVALYSDKAMWWSVREAALAYVERYCDPESLKGVLATVIARWSGHRNAQQS